MPLFTVPGSWVEAQTITTFATNRTGATLAIGNVCSFDLTGSDGDVDAYATTPNDPFANIIMPATAHLEGWLFCLALEATANDKQGKFLVRGIGLCLTTGIAISESLMCANGVHSAAKRTDGNVSIGIALTAGSAAATTKVLFDGWALTTAGSASL